MSGFKPARLNELLNSKRRLTARSLGVPAAISIGGQQARGFNLKIDSGPLPEFQRFYLTVGSRAADHVVKEHVGSEHAREQGD